MTKAKLETMGIFFDRKLRNKDNQYWCQVIEDYLVINKLHTIENVMQMIFDIGVDRGIKTGKKERSNEFKDLINNA